MASKKSMPVAKANSNTIGYMPYSLRAQVANPAEAETEKKITACAQRWETVALAKLARHIHEHNSQFSKGVILGVLTDMVECIKEQLTSGNFVKLDGLCTLGYTYSCNLQEKAEDFNPSTDIKRINCRAKFDSEFEVLMNAGAKFTLVDTRETQATQAREQKAALTAEVGGESDDDGNGGNSGGDNSGGEITE